MEYLIIHFKLKHQSWTGDGSIKVELFSDHIFQLEGLLVTNSRSLLFSKVFWEPTFKVTYFLKRFLHEFFVLDPLPKGSETSFWCAISAFFLQYKYCLLNCVSTDQVSILCSLILEMMMSQISLFIFDHLMQWLTMEKRE